MVKISHELVFGIYIQKYVVNRPPQASVISRSGSESILDHDTFYDGAIWKEYWIFPTKSAQPSVIKKSINKLDLNYLYRRISLSCFYKKESQWTFLEYSFMLAYCHMGKSCWRNLKCIFFLSLGIIYAWQTVVRFSPLKMKQSNN